MDTRRIAAAPNRGMWVWTTRDVVSGRQQSEYFLRQAKNAHVTDVYLYMDPSDYATQGPLVGAFNARANAANMRVWALDGGRVYFSDADGPDYFYQGIKNAIAFNRAAAEHERFFGFHADNEVQDSGGHVAFHNGIPDSKLDPRPGTGTWKESQSADRTAIMRDWLVMHQTAASLLHPAGMRLAAAMPSWTGDYCGEPLRVRFPNDGAPRVCVMNHMMGFVDDYVVMSYNTDPRNAAGRVVEQAAYASMHGGPSTRVYAAVETHCDVGAKISYGDTPGKQSKQAVLQDIDAITANLRPYPAFSGVVIHDWAGWDALPARTTHQA